MEDMIKALLETSSQYGSGYLIAALTLALYWVAHKDLIRERSAHSKTSEKLIELSTASIRADMEHTSAIETLSKILDNIERRLQ
jgi:hypothetical protein